MKRRICGMIALVLAVLLLAGCASGLFVTKTYKTCNTFTKRHQPGMEKQAVVERLGYPRGWKDAQGVYHPRSDTEEEAFYQALMDETSIQWVYEFYQYSDPANLCRLRVSFDGEGKSTAAQMEFVPGG